MARIPIHPGEVLADEMAELGLSARALGKALGVPGNRVSQIITGRRGISTDTALRLGLYFGMSVEFWLNLQRLYELDLVGTEGRAAIEAQVTPRA